MNFIYGINAVTESLKARGRSFAWVGIAKERHDLRLQRVVDECRRQGVAVRFVPRPELDRMAECVPRKECRRPAYGESSQSSIEKDIAVPRAPLLASDRLGNAGLGS